MSGAPPDWAWLLLGALRLTGMCAPVVLLVWWYVAHNRKHQRPPRA